MQLYKAPCVAAHRHAPHRFQEMICTVIVFPRPMRNAHACIHAQRPATLPWVDACRFRGTGGRENLGGKTVQRASLPAWARSSGGRSDLPARLSDVATAALFADRKLRLARLTKQARRPSERFEYQFGGTGHRRAVPRYRRFATRRPGAG